MSEYRTEVAIAGGGPVGLTLACLLGAHGVATVLVDRAEPKAQLDAAYDGRTTAVALGASRVLEAAGVWGTLGPEAAAIADIRIADGGSPVVLDFAREEVGAPAFGWIVENRRLRERLFARVAALPSVTHLTGAEIVGSASEPAAATLTLRSGDTIKAPLLIGADGAASPTRAAAGIGVWEHRYRQTALAFVAAHERPHHGVAVEHFLPDGPFATLPMRDGADGVPRSAVVWTVPEAAAPDYLALSEARFTAELQRRFGDHRGRVSLAGPRFAFPLRLMLARAYTAPRLALAGEAAHVIHPIAGQGLNLGWRDVALLAELVVERLRLGLDPGAAAVTGRYARSRTRDSLAMAAATDGLNRLFSTAVPPVAALRDLGLAAVGRIGPAKRFFMRAAMGTEGGLPRLVRGLPI